jgi:hypothetical protein
MRCQKTSGNFGNDGRCRTFQNLRFAILPVAACAEALHVSLSNWIKG